MPEMDGYECCRHLRAKTKRYIPIIIISALDSVRSREESLAAGADAYFTKPFDPKEVVDTVRRLIDMFGDEGDASDQSPAEA